MSTPRIAYRPHAETTLEQARDVRARAWLYTFDCYRNKKAGVSSTGDDGKETKNVPDNPISPQRL